MIEIKDNQALITLSGRLDTATAPKVEEMLRTELAGATDVNRIVIDAAELSYISSSGLRVILGLRKQYAATEMHNVQKDVRAVLDLTGISKLLVIR